MGDATRRGLEEEQVTQGGGLSQLRGTQKPARTDPVRDPDESL